MTDQTFARRSSLLAVLSTACVLGGFAALASCSSSGSASGPPAPPPTFHKDVEPLLQAHCQSCHVQGGIGPFALLTYDDAKSNVFRIVAQTSARTMPPWGATTTSECAPRFGWQHDIRLTDAQIKLLQDWKAAGTPEGDPADAPKGPAPAPLALSNVSVEVAPQTPFTLQHTNQDTFRCYVLDPKITTTQYVNGTNIVAGNRRIVHHALVFADPTGASKKLAGPDGSYDCFGGPGIQASGLVAAWAPGGQPLEYPSNVGMQIDAGTLLVMQVHYHPHTDDPENLTPDSTKFQMRLGSAKPEYALINALIGNFDQLASNGDGLQAQASDNGAAPQFLIPAGAKGRVLTMMATIPPQVGNAPTPPDLFMAGVTGHMHYVGTDVKITLHHRVEPDNAPKDECLIQIPAWDFNWQRLYMYDTDIASLPKFHPFDKLEIRCTYDNSLANPKVISSLAEQGISSPRDIRLGETTLDEMCLGVFSVVYKN